jgi:hypothetical protein
VQNYSTTAITNPVDKLIAISGIARLYADLTGDTYIAGMWRKNLESQFSWKRIGPTCETNSTPPANRCGPTWSWASIDSPVDPTYGNNGEHFMFITVQDVVLTHATGDVMGLLTGGWLDLRGTLKPMSLLRALKVQEIQDVQITSEKWVLVEHYGATGRVEDSNSKVLLDIPTSNRQAFDHDNAQGNLFYMLTYVLSFQESRYATFLCLRVID